MTLQWDENMTPKAAVHKHTSPRYRVNLDRPSLLSCLLIVAATLAVLTPMMALVVWHTRGAGW